MAKIMGILNVTPDSFSDAGRFLAPEAAVRQAAQMIEEGADFLDVGGESTRPGAPPVSDGEEVRRTEGVVRELVRHFGVPVSIDTTKATVAQAALDQGATWINDISGGADPQFATLCRKYDAGIVLMHMQGTPRTMQQEPYYPGGVVPEVLAFLKSRRDHFLEAGIGEDKIWIDPGIGFGKTLDHNLALLRATKQLTALAPVVVGTSRKSFLARVLGDPQLPMEARESGTLASNLWAAQNGAHVLRVHDVGAMVRALTTWEAIQG